MHVLHRFKVILDTAFMHVQDVLIMHDFAVTEKYAVFLDHAMVFDPKHMVKAKTVPFR
jgi:carotenoid cleavage dioxygenase-like enzyme